MAKKTPEENDAERKAETLRKKNFKLLRRLNKGGFTAPSSPHKAKPNTEYPLLYKHLCAFNKR
jgi:hypothetical protein